MWLVPGASRAIAPWTGSCLGTVRGLVQAPSGHMAEFVLFKGPGSGYNQLKGQFKILHAGGQQGHWDRLTHRAEPLGGEGPPGRLPLRVCGWQHSHQSHHMDDSEAEPTAPETPVLSSVSAKPFMVSWQGHQQRLSASDRGSNATLPPRGGGAWGRWGRACPLTPGERGRTEQNRSCWGRREGLDLENGDAGVRGRGDGRRSPGTGQASSRGGGRGEKQVGVWGGQSQGPGLTLDGLPDVGGRWGGGRTGSRGPWQWRGHGQDTPVTWACRRGHKGLCTWQDHCDLERAGAPPRGP